MKYLCKAPFSLLEIVPDGSFRVCCKQPANPIKRPNNTVYRINEDHIDDIWYSPWMNNFRQRFINGEKPEECKMCWDDESAGIISYRKQLSNLDIPLENPEIHSLVLKLSNKCNCACRICSFWLSSLWQAEELKTKQFDPKYNWFIELNDAPKITQKNWEPLKEKLRKLKVLYIYGGEPLINDEVLLVLRYLVNEGHSKSITLYLNTNGTVINDEIIGLLEKFEHTEVNFSIDDVFHRYDYERWPAKYVSIFRDLHEFHEQYNQPNIKVVLYTTLTIFNVLYINEILSEFKKLPKFKINFTNMIHEPYVLSLYGLSEDVKPEIEKRIRAIEWHANWEYSCNADILINFMYLYKNDYTASDYIVQLDNKLGFYDTRRKQDWRNTFPDLYMLLNQTTQKK